MQLFGFNITLGNKEEPQVSKRGIAYEGRLWGDIVDEAAGSARVNPSSAERCAAVYSCINVLAQSVASLPLILYERNKDNSKQRATKNPLYRLLNYFPTRHLTRFEWLESIIWHLMLRGNAYCLIETYKGSVQYLEILHPDFVTVEVNSQNTFTYKYYNPTNGQTKLYNELDIVHFKLASGDGVYGRGPIQVVKETVGTAISGQEASASFYRNGVRLSGVLEHPKTLGEETNKAIAESFRRAYGGPSNFGKVPVLEEGMKYTPISMTLEQAQFIEGRKFSRSEICGIFQVPPFMIGDFDKATYSNFEQSQTDFVTRCLRPLLVRLEMALTKSLFGMETVDDFAIEFLMDALLRGDTKSRYEAYKIASEGGMLTLNEIRDMENRNPFDFGDVTLIPLNMKVVGNEEDLRRPANEDLVDNQTKKGKDTEDDTDEEDTPDEDDKRNMLNAAIRRIETGFGPLLEACFRRLLTKEVKYLKSKADTQLELDEVIRSYSDKQLPTVEEALPGHIACLAEQIRMAAEYSLNNHSPLPENFVADYCKEYCSRRFDDMWGTDITTLEPKCLAVVRSVPAKEAKELLQKLTQVILGAENE